MRLSRIKLAGFKSFVDPTTIDLPSNLVGIVGPNGCGKSNTIDAVRWVMGESSAKYLRGESMDDVIFTGSSSRKPVGQASVELIFDTADGAVGGEYAAYSEISVKRQVSRDGQSVYLLNGRRCRRRDITDIFLGTGLGPRSYAIIEQGMISRVIEAKPEELRVYLEEAAGISKYKERRRETENRIRHTRENLERLDDLREEVDRQLERLARQSRTAEKYKALKAEERRLRAELLGLRFVGQGEALARREAASSELQTALERAIAAQRSAESQIEKDRQAHVAANDGFNQVQGRFYRVGADISRAEQTIQHARETRQRQEQELRQVQRAWQEASEHIEQDRARLAELDAGMADDAPALDRSQAGQRAANACLAGAESDMLDWQTRWEDYGRRSAEPAQQAQVERSRMEQLERHMGQLEQRAQKLAEEHRGVDCSALQMQVEDLIVAEVDAAERLPVCEEALEQARAALGEVRERQAALRGELDEHRGELQRQRGRLASLEALQQAALADDDAAVGSWLAGRGLDAAPRLAQRIGVAAGWERAAEAVLGRHLDALCVADIDAHAGALGELDSGSLTLVEDGRAASSGSDGDRRLADVVTGPLSLAGLLAGVYLAEDLPAALARRAGLAPGESVVSRCGAWLGCDWLHIERGAADAGEGVLAREGEIAALRGSTAAAESHIAGLESAAGDADAALQGAERRRDEAQQAVNAAQRGHAEARARLDGQRLRLEQQQTRAARLGEELAENTEQLEGDREALLLARERRAEALAAMQRLAEEREALQAERERLREALDSAREAAREQSDAGQQIALRMESMRAARAATEQNLARMQGQLDQLVERREQLQAQLGGAEVPLVEEQERLAGLLESRVEVEMELAEARAAVEAVEARLREHEQRRLGDEREAERARDKLHEARLAAREVKVRLQTLTEQIIEAGQQPEKLLRELPEEGDIDAWVKRLEALEQRIARLGPINLAAIDEYREQSTRKEYLDSQHADISQALDTLEGAIAKIDRETRARFKETFDQVNGRVQALFPRLFGGGHASLELTGDDLLNTGVSIMARPPGKKVTNIHLLSGGEKALTAVALVFAFFELNPAPFCMLDEVDAPLDDANVGRFCELVREMSERVQFIFITHNKATMELSEQLMGVTMYEPGVSRLVSVDVQEAARLAGA